MRGRRNVETTLAKNRPRHIRYNCHRCYDINKNQVITIMPVTIVVVPSPATNTKQPSLQTEPPQLCQQKEIQPVLVPLVHSIHHGTEEIRVATDEKESQIKKKKSTSLNARVKNDMRSVIADTNKNSFCEIIVAKISSSVHVSHIEDRRMFWEHCKTSGKEFLQEACDHFLKEYLKFHKQCDRGSDKYAIFYLTWQEQVHLPTTIAYVSLLRQKLTSAYMDSVTDDTWNCIMSTLLYVIYNEVQTTASQYITSTEDACPPTAYTDDSDVALLRLGGWALYSCINYRKLALKGKSKIIHTSDRLEIFKAELDILETLVDRQKVNMPTAISAQDRGYMTFPCTTMMPFVTIVNKMIKEHVNPVSYEKYGSKLFDVS